jgi:hypothetical protein
MLSLANLIDEQQVKAEDDYPSYVRVGGENTLEQMNHQSGSVGLWMAAMGGAT